MDATFGTLLRDWRARRRLSQLDLGLAANVSARHICFLETGRARPSQPMVRHLSEVLDMPRAARNGLLQAAGFSAAYRARDPDAAELVPIRAAVDWTLERHDPYPGMALDRHWRLLQLNRCATGLLGALGLGVGDSLIEAFLAAGPLRDAMANRDEVARYMAARLQTESAHLGGDPLLDRAAEQLRNALPARMPTAEAPAPAVIPVTYRAGGLELSLFSTLAQFGSTEDVALADLRIELMFPADEASKAALVQLAGPVPGRR
jgi:transcriptional regulator with XRE-family HTH domain